MRSHRTDADADLRSLAVLGDAWCRLCYFDADRYSTIGNSDAVPPQLSAAQQVSVRLGASADVWDHVDWGIEDKAPLVLVVLRSSLHGLGFADSLRKHGDEQ